MQIIYYLIPLVVLAGLIGWLKTPKGKGVLGEIVIKITIGKTKPGKQYVINDLMITAEDGKSSQIDHVLINKNGVFVIETKNYSGRIYGSEKQLEWTQVFNYGHTKNKFYNPLKQNATHIYRIRNEINKNIPVISCIVFIQGNIEYIEAPNVYTVKQLKEKIKKEAENQLTAEQMKETYNKLKYIKENKETSNSEHIEQIEEMKKGIEEGICPRCGGKLVERKSEKGIFLGCSNYPKCKFTAKKSLDRVSHEG
ncbi:MAG: NERD domain-containing protein [Eubacteriales bacterium]